MLTEKGKRVLWLGVAVCVAAAAFGPVGVACVLLAVLLYKGTRGKSES